VFGGLTKKKAKRHIVHSILLRSCKLISQLLVFTVKHLKKTSSKPFQVLIFFFFWQDENSILCSWDFFFNMNPLTSEITFFHDQNMYHVFLSLSSYFLAAVSHLSTLGVSEKTKKPRKPEKSNRKNRLKFIKNRLVRFRFYKPETEKTEPKPKKIGKNQVKPEKTEPNRFEPVFVLKKTQTLILILILILTSQ